MVLIDKDALIGTINATMEAYDTEEDAKTVQGMQIATEIVSDFPTQLPMSEELIRLGGAVHGKHQTKVMTLKLFSELLTEDRYDTGMLVSILDRWLKNYYEMETDE